MMRGIQGDEYSSNEFFDLADRYAGLDVKNNPLLKLSTVIPSEDFRGRLEAAWRAPGKANQKQVANPP